MKKPVQKSQLSRREFIGSTAMAAGAFTIVPRHVLGGVGFKAPSDTVNIAAIGVWGKGRSDIAAVAHENIVALCDVDDRHMAKIMKHEWQDQDGKVSTIGESFPKAKTYRDFREMLEKEKGIDAVTVTTPDHTHAPAALMAMRRGKHAFVQKPLTHTVHEARMMAEVARANKVVTQMGNQGHAGEGGRLVNEWIWDGAIGGVTEVHCWTNRPIWPQNIPIPKEIPSVPQSLDWNLWLGPATFRPYHPNLAHFVWRGWREYGTGALGDMGAHIIDHPYWALGLELPDSVQASSSAFNDVSYPVASKVTYTFPKRGKQPAVKFVWYDGGLMPDRPADLEPGRKMGDRGGGCLFIGEKGNLMCSVYGNNPRIIPETKMRAYKRPEKSIPRSPGIAQEWIDAIKGNGKTTSNFDYAAKLTETMLLGNVAILLKDKNMVLEYDNKKGEFSNLPEANSLLTKEYREGFTLDL